LSYHAMGVPHWGHFDRGLTTDSLRGSLHTQTFKKLPIMHPKTKETIRKKVFSTSI